MKYSLLSYGENISEQEVLQLTKKGIKVILFLREDAPFDKECLKGCPFFECHRVSGEMTDPFRIEDGDKEDFFLLDELPTDFNREQYEVEHASLNAQEMKAIIVKASAGTGKTKVMIDRIMHILITQENVTPKDICMITFTNKATNQMQQKIQDRIASYYAWTKDVRFLHMIEELHLMNISTIDTYLHHFIQKNGFMLGLDRQTNIRGFKYEKMKILRQVINVEVKKQLEKNNINPYFMPLGMDQLINFFYELWEAMEEKGYFADMLQIDVGGERILKYISDKETQMAWINNIIPTVLKNTKKEYDEVRKRKNSLSLKDVTDEVKKIVPTSVPLSIPKYIFVDEFQDTDNSQIEVLSGIAKSEADTQLFVVGDEKQSIYHFRGSTERAFSELHKHIRNTKEYMLKKNYRTVKKTLTDMNLLFEYLSKEGFLGTKEEVKAEPVIEGDGNFEIISTNEGKIEDAVLKAIEEKKDGSTCILCQKNWQVATIVQALRAKQIPCQGKMAGTFYSCKPVVDFYLILSALLYPGQKPLEGIAGETSYFKGLSEEEVHDILERYRNHLKDMMIFNLLDYFVEERKPWEKYTYPYLQKHYQMNLQKLIKIIYTHFTGQYATLIDVYSFLDNKVATASAEEDEAYPDAAEDMIEVMTVHQAKGLEWDTIIIPYTGDACVPDTDKHKKKDSKYFVFERLDNNILQIGWKFISREDAKPEKKYKNYYYDSICEKEDLEQLKESIRVLYVASTRCKKNLYYILPKRIEEETWAYYLAFFNCINSTKMLEARLHELEQKLEQVIYEQSNN